ncbi:MAG: TonB-dependent receptor [Salibacteraceae bacterium]
MLKLLIRIIAISSLLFLCISTPIHAQDTCSWVLSGKVIDEHNGEALGYSNVYIKELEIGAVSDENGFYKITGLCSGTYTVQVSHVGCAPVLEKVQVRNNTTHNFHPEHHAEELNQVMVTGEKRKEETSHVALTLTSKEMEETKGKSLGESLKKVTGVTTLSTGNSINKPVIHGLHSNRIMILNNGIRHESQQWGNEHAPEIDPFIANELTVIKGANSMRYGPDAIAGVILVNPKAMRTEPGLDGEVNLVGFSNGRQGVASAMFDGNLGKVPGLSYRLQGTYKKAGNVHSPDYYLKNTGLEEYNFSWAAGYNRSNFGIEAFYSQFNTDIGIFSAAHIGNLTDLERAFNSPVPLESADFTYNIDRPYQHIEHELFKASAFVHTGNTGKLKFTYARQYNKRLEFDKDKPLNDSLAALNTPELQFEITTHTGDVVWEHFRTRNFKGSIGISGISQGNTYKGRYFIPNFKKYGGGVFWIERWKPDSSNLELEAGIRYDYIYQQIFKWEDDVIISPEHRYQNLSANIGGIYSLNEHFKLRGNAGLAWRPPNVNELYSDGVHHGAAAIEIGDPNLVEEQAYNFSISGEYSKNKLRFGVDVYYNFMNNFIYLKPEQPPKLTIRGAFPTFYYTQVDATLKGIDFTFQYEISKSFNWTTKASLLRAYNNTEQEYLTQMPPDQIENSLEYKFPKDYKNFKEMYVGVSVLSVMKQWRVPPNSDYVAPPDGYTIVELQAGTGIPLGKHQMNVGFGVSNLFNVSYRNYLNRFRYYTDEMGRNFTLRLQIPFTLIAPK